MDLVNGTVEGHLDVGGSCPLLTGSDEGLELLRGLSDQGDVVRVQEHTDKQVAGKEGTTQATVCQMLTQ